MLINKIYLLSTMFAFLPMWSYAQKITLGACTTRDGGAYKGEMQAGKPHGKGTAVYKNGDIYEGQYVKGKRQGQGIYRSLTEKNMKANGSRTSSTGSAPIIL